MEPVRVLLVDDHALFRRGISAVLAAQENIQVVGEASNGLEAISKASELKPDVVLMDLSMPNVGGLEATAAIGAELPTANVLICTISEKDADLFAAMKAGAKGYIMKNIEPEELVHSVWHVARGGVVISPTMAGTLLNEFQGRKPVEDVGSPESGQQLSNREQEVLQLVAQGSTNKEIAASLFISENTVKTHLHSIMEKLHLANRSQAAAYATRVRAQKAH
ncbi:MAG: response regulator transcription factor [Chloroflexi bacterium]|nr:response regulator transcription factor [Chloroflexota bacterium]